ncbi:MAG TPA: hypothetical protein DCE42_17215 [Myxococcales bacterium]|nr:hypothetical protein [Myxococcales bacterium]
MSRKRFFCVLAMCMMLVSFGTKARAESELYKFCKSDINTSEEIKSSITAIWAGTTLFKAILASTSYTIVITKVNAQTLELAENQAEIAERIIPVFVPATRAFFKAILPALSASSIKMKKTNNFFKTVFVGKLREGNLGASVYGQHPVVTFYEKSLKLFKYWDYAAGAIMAYQAAAKLTCMEVKKAYRNCISKSNNKSKCDVSFNDLPDVDENMSAEKRSCSANDAAAKYIALMTQLAPMVRQMRTANNKILAALKPLKSAVSSASAALSPLKAPLNTARTMMKTLQKGLIPLKLFSNQIKALLAKRVRVKFKIKVGKIRKQTKKCTRPKNLVKDIKKYTSAAQKAFKTAMKKLIDPIMRKIQNKIVKIPGVQKAENTIKKIASKVGIGKKLNDVSKLLNSIPSKTFTAKLKSATTKIKTLNTQMSR